MPVGDERPKLAGVVARSWSPLTQLGHSHPGESNVETANTADRRFGKTFQNEILASVDPPDHGEEDRVRGVWHLSLAARTRPSLCLLLPAQGRALVAARRMRYCPHATNNLLLREMLLSLSVGHS